MTDIVRYTRVDFKRFKAFESFVLHLRPFNVLVGPNNAGKSTVLAAFRVLSAAIRRASARSPTVIRGPFGNTWGYAVDLSAISVAEENIYFNYDDSEPASVKFRLSNGNELLLYFPERGSCYLLTDAQGPHIKSPKDFRKHFNCPIGFVPILGPVEHNEPLYEKEAARRALFTYQAARNFRNIWYHFPEKFEEFRDTLRQTWSGMDIEKPVVDVSYERARLHMFCPEDRIPRELFWAGFGFQVWCQMLTHLIQSRSVSLFLIDEPDIYLHSDLQRQLLGLLRNLGPDVVIATHSTEIISESETNDIVLIDKRRKSARRINQPSQLTNIFSALGSRLNPTLTQIAKTRKVVFVEGDDFQLLGRVARKLGLSNVANQSDFAVIPIEGFNPDRVRSMKAGIEKTLGGKISAAIILDRDYRSDSECDYIIEKCKEYADYVVVHRCKEIENFLLVPAVIDKATERAVADRNRRSGSDVTFADSAAEFLNAFACAKHEYVLAQYLASGRRFAQKHSPKLDEATVTEAGIKAFNGAWQRPLDVIPGKEALSALNGAMQAKFGVNVTQTAITEAMTREEIPQALGELLARLSKFASAT